MVPLIIFVFIVISLWILHPGAMCVLTTPALWSDHLLQIMATVNLVDTDLFTEHVYTYSLALLGWHFGRAGFAMDKLKFGYFELLFNLWAMAERYKARHYLGRFVMASRLVVQ